MNARPPHAAHGQPGLGSPYGTTPKPSEKLSTTGMVRVDYGKTVNSASAHKPSPSSLQTNSSSKSKTSEFKRSHTDAPSVKLHGSNGALNGINRAKSKLDISAKDSLSKLTGTSRPEFPGQHSSMGTLYPKSNFKIPKMSSKAVTPGLSSSGSSTPFSDEKTERKEKPPSSNEPSVAKTLAFKIPKKSKQTENASEVSQNAGVHDGNRTKKGAQDSESTSNHGEKRTDEELTSKPKMDSSSQAKAKEPEIEQLTKAKPGRPKKPNRESSQFAESPASENNIAQNSPSTEKSEREMAETPKRKRGRPKKDSQAENSPVQKLSDQFNTPKTSKRRRNSDIQSPSEPVNSDVSEKSGKISENQEPFTKKKRGRPASVSKPPASVKDVECGVCNKVLPSSDFKRHNYVEHNGEARLAGEPPMTSESEKKVAWKAAMDFSKRLVCHKCNKKYVSVAGYAYHVGTCGRTDEDIEAAMKTCPICLSPFLHLNAHIRAQHSAKSQPSPGEKENETGEKRRRSAAVKALETLKDTEDAGEPEKTGVHRFSSPRTHINHYVLRGWTNQIAQNGSAKCRFAGCSNTETTVDAMKEHDFHCQFSTKRSTHFSCKLCKFTSEDKATMVQHVTTHDGKETKGDNFALDDDERGSSAGSSSDESEELGAKSKSRNTSFGTPGTAVKCVHYFGLDDAELRDFKNGNALWHTLQWTRAFRQENYALSNSSFTDLKTLPAKNYVPLTGQELLPYLPVSTTSTPFASTSLSRTQFLSYSECQPQFTSLEVFQGGIINGVPTLYCGGPIWAASWCPIPDEHTGYENRRQKQYLAIATENNAEGSKVACTFSGPGLVQIWDCGNLVYDESAQEPPTFVMGLAHDYGEISALAWCPSGAWEPECRTSEGKAELSLQRLGLLAAACSDGTVRIFAVPHPSKFTKAKQEPVYKVSAVLTLRLGTPANCLSLCWDLTQRHRWIVAGFGNGVVGIWDLATTVPYLRVVTGDLVELRPVMSFAAHLAGVKAVSLSLHEGRRYLATCGLEKTISLWDLEDHAVRVTALEKPWSTAMVWKQNWPTVAFAHDDSLTGGRTFGSFTDFGFDNAKPTSVWAQLGPHWDICENALMDTLVSGSETGLLVGCSSIPFPKDITSHVPVSLIRFALFRTDVVNTTASSSVAKLSVVPSTLATVQALSVKESSTSTEANDKGMSETLRTQQNGATTSSQKGLVFYDVIQNQMSTKDKLSKILGTSEKVLASLNVNNTDNLPSINKVSCNPNTQSFTWVAACGQSGLVRLVSMKNWDEKAKVTGILNKHFKFS